MSNPSKELPKKLEDELNEMKYYKRKSSGSNTDKLLAYLGNNNNNNNNNNLNENKLNYQSSTDDLFNHKSSKPPIQKVFDDSYENKMYDEIFGGLIPSANRSKLPAGSGYDAMRRSSSQEKDFTSSLINRVKVLEAECKEQRKQLSQQIADNLKLEEELNLYKTTTNQQQRDSIEKIQRITKENQQLQDQIHEMEDFLADYGLEWVGNSSHHHRTQSNGRVDSREGKEDRDESDGQIVEKHLAGFSEFQRCINQLNEIIYSEPAQIRTDERKGRLVNPSELVEKIIITYYKDGLMINRGPFRPIRSNSYKSFMQDILDGYFPSEFRDQYPDGVIFELKNKEQHCFEGSPQQNEDFMSMKEFLNRLPKTVIKSGELIDLQKDVRLRLSVDSADLFPSKGNIFDIKDADIEESQWRDDRVTARRHQMIVVDTEAAHERKQNTDVQTTKIVVKWSDQVSFVLVLYSYQTIGDLRKILAKQHSTEIKTKPSFELRRTFPTRKLEDYETFSSADLVPNGIIHTRFLS